MATSCVKSIFFCLVGRLVFLLADQQTLFQGSFVEKRNEMKFPNFDQNHGLRWLNTVLAVCDHGKRKVPGHKLKLGK